MNGKKSCRGPSLSRIGSGQVGGRHKFFSSSLGGRHKNQRTLIMGEMKRRKGSTSLSEKL